MKGQGGCRGGGKVPKTARKALEGRKLGEKFITIQGMRCENCKNSVERQINQLPGAAAKVELRKNMVVVALDRFVSDEELTEAVEKAGFQVTKIEYKEA